jgi:hypothetical protein
MIAFETTEESYASKSSKDLQPFMSCQLPELQALCFLRSRADVVRGVCDRFHNLISTIVFDSVEINVIESVLQQIGERLCSLTISDFMFPQFLLRIVVGLCANLNALTFIQIFVMCGVHL